MPVRSPSALLALAALAVVWSVVATGASGTGAAALVPILVLLAPLLVGRYPGERRIARLRRSRRPDRSPVRAIDARMPRSVRRTIARGRLLLARGLAVRPPPARPAHA